MQYMKKKRYLSIFIFLALGCLIIFLNSLFLSWDLLCLTFLIFLININLNREQSLQYPLLCQVWNTVQVTEEGSVLDKHPARPTAGKESMQGSGQ